MTARSFARPAVTNEPAAAPVAPPGVDAAELTAASTEDCAYLLDPGSWGETLNRFAHTMKLAVALTDSHGSLLGPCHNPQPVWSLAREAKPAFTGSCPFCLDPREPCTAVSDALASGEIAYTGDPAGMAHAAIPLLLGRQRLGALIAGQTFALYPQPLVLQRIAKSFGASSQEMWSAAVHQLPLSRATLHLYAELLLSLGQAFLRQRYLSILDRKLHQTDERYRLLIEASTDRALFTIDSTGFVTSWNPGAERLLGYTEAEILGKNYAVFFTPEDINNEVPEQRIRLIEWTGTIEHEGWRVRKDGTRFLSETVTTALGEGDAREYGKLLHDLTQERKSAEASSQAQKLESIGIMAGGIAHDFNNLLTSILGNVSLALMGLPAGDPARPLLDIAERSSIKAAALIAQLLAYAGKGEANVTPFDLSGLISEILPLIQTSIPKNVQLDLRLRDDLLWIKADASEVQQIVMNLVINGAEAVGAENGTLLVSTGPARLDTNEQSEVEGGRPDAVYFEVRDSGCGMDEATRRRIFEPFFTTKFTGRGLGLAAVSGIVRRLKGRLDLESTPGEGSTFRVIFPGVPPQLPEPKLIFHNDLSCAGVIMVVDDDPMVRGFACAVLERYGFSVLTAENGKAAVDLFRSNAETITAVLMDLTMPVMGGGEAFYLIKEIRPEIPIIISSGYGESAIREQFTSALAGVIPKPYTVTELREKIAAVLTAVKA